MKNQKKRKKLKNLTANFILNLILSVSLVGILILAISIYFRFFYTENYIESEEVEMFVMYKDKECRLEEDRYGNPVEVLHYLVHVQEDDVDDYITQLGYCGSKNMYMAVEEGDKVLMKRYIYKNDDGSISNVQFDFIKKLED